MLAKIVYTSIAFTLIVGFVFVSQAVACDKCEERAECTGTDSVCLMCDPLGPGMTCSTVEYKDFEDATVNDCKPGGDLTCVSKTLVVCYSEADCVEGEWLSWAFCGVDISGHGWTCDAPWPKLAMCQECDTTNVVPVNRWNWTCE